MDIASTSYEQGYPSYGHGQHELWTGVPQLWTRLATVVDTSSLSMHFALPPLDVVMDIAGYSRCHSEHNANCSQGTDVFSAFSIVTAVGLGLKKTSVLPVALPQK